MQALSTVKKRGVHAKNDKITYLKICSVVIVSYLKYLDLDCRMGTWYLKAACMDINVSVLIQHPLLFCFFSSLQNIMLWVHVL